MFLPPIMSAVSESFANILDKLILNQYKLSGKIFTTYLFLFMGILSLPLLYLFKPAGIPPHIVLILILIIIGSTIQNYLFYVGLSNKHLSQIEPIIDSQPILTILIAFIVYPPERNPLILILGIITTCALLYTHIGKNEFKKIEFAFDKYSGFVYFSMLLSAILEVVYKYILININPVFLYAVRAFGVSVILSILYKPKVLSLKKNQYFLFILSATLYSAAAILQYISISKIGVSLTAVLITISPAIIYLCSPIFLKEKLSINKIIGSSIIIACVFAATFIL